MDIKKILFKTNTIDVEKALPDAVVFCNKDGKIQWVNDKSAEVFETSKMHLLTSNIADFIENVQNVINCAISTDAQVIVKLAGKEVYFNMTAKNIEEGFVLAFRDIITNQINNIQQPNNTSKDDKNSFLLKISNDFKSPLQSIIGFSQAMTDGLGGSMSIQQEKYIKIINKNSSDLMYFVNKLMELMQSEIDLKSPDIKKFDIVNTINTVIKFNEQLYKEKEIRWTYNIEAGLKSTVFSDEAIMKVVLQNIFEVILKSIDMGEIIVSLFTPTEDYIKSKNILGDNFIMISISSNSMLLSESDLDCLFEPYNIVDSANKKNLLRAMTLACAKNLIQTLNGYIWVESKILKNTSFNILISQNKD